MENIKFIIAKNISELRISNSMTQLELAEKLHYSDKAVSKWERGDSMPEISTLVAIANLFGVTLDYLVSEKHSSADKSALSVYDNRKKTNRTIITAISILLVWFIALVVYVFIDIISSDIHWHWVTFLYSVPAALIVWLVFNSIWFNTRLNYLIISLLVWSVIACIHITFLIFKINIWQIYALGVPGQLVILLWSKLLFKKEG